MSHTPKPCTSSRAQLVLQLHDSNGLPVRDDAGEPLNLMMQWRPLEDEQLPEVARDEEGDWMDYLSGAGCADPGAMAGAQPPAARGTWVSHPRLLLEPDSLYRAVLGPIIPLAVVPLDADGTAQMAMGEMPTVIELAGTVPERIELIAAASGGNKLLITPGGIRGDVDGCPTRRATIPDLSLNAIAGIEYAVLELIDRNQNSFEFSTGPFSPRATPPSHTTSIHSRIQRRDFTNSEASPSAVCSPGPNLGGFVTLSMA